MLFCMKPRSLLCLICAVFLLCCGGGLLFSAAGQGEEEYGMVQHLTPEEEHVILRKGTEAPFSGEYWDFFEEGIYRCKRCGADLYRSEDKFAASCGWPSFDDEIPGAVRRVPDPDGRRTEIVCARCGAHLGHVFEGEGLTPKNVRHCVNSLSLAFLGGEEMASRSRIVFGGGCFWGVEYHFQKLPGVLETTVGYAGGETPNPTYEQVCSGTTGHAEVLEVIYDPSQISFRDLCVLFFEIHDPTQVDRQGPDVGSQYRSVIFYTEPSQKEVALELMEKLEEKGYAVATELAPLETFWKAEEYHQDYYEKSRKAPYCHIHTPRF